MTVPTAEGMRRYAETGGYTVIGNFACTCLRTCLPRCAGECGCKACDMTFVVFCDEAGLGGFEPWTAEDKMNALLIYRDTSTPFAFHPSLEGFKRYPDTNGRYAGDHDLPCKCAASCEPLCDGVCGCPACETAFAAVRNASRSMDAEGVKLPSADVLSAHRRKRGQ